MVIYIFYSADEPVTVVLYYSESQMDNIRKVPSPHAKKAGLRKELVTYKSYFNLILFLISF